MERTEQITDSERLIRLPEVLTRVGMSRAAWYRAVADDEAPRPVKLTTNGRTVAWSLREVSEWIEGRLSAREGSRKVG